jgi:hypothetical protein
MSAHCDTVAARMRGSASSCLLVSHLFEGADARALRHSRSKDARVGEVTPPRLASLCAWPRALALGSQMGNEREDIFMRERSQWIQVFFREARDTNKRRIDLDCLCILFDNSFVVGSVFWRVLSLVSGLLYNRWGRP